MPLNNPNFQLDVSKELIRLQQELLELQDLDELENVRFDEGSGTYVYPPPSQRAPLSQDQYDDLMEEHAARRPKTAIPQTQQAITNLRQQSLQQYNQLKQSLQNDLQSTGYNGPPILDFDDNSLRIEIGCGFKEFLDRFANAMPVVRQTVATDPNDERPLQDIFREYATPRVKKEYEDAFRDSLQEQRDLGDQAYNDPQNPIDLQGATTGDDVVTAVFGGNTSQTGICLDDNHGSPQGPEFLTENMDALQQSGVTTLFIEHFWQEQQQMLDDYLSGLPMDPVLDKAISKLDKPFTDKTPNHTPLRTMLDEAKAKNIRVVGLDSYEAKATQRHPLTEDRRVAAFNDTAAKVVQREKGNGKFLLLAGSAHNNTDEGGFPGLSQMLGIPALKIDKDSGEIGVSKESNSRKMRTESEQSYYEAFMDAVFKANPDAFKGDANAVKSRCENIRKAADKLTRKIGPMLGAIDPQKAIQLAEDAAKRVSDQIQKGEAALGGTDADATILAAAEGPAEYIDTVEQLKQAIESGRGDEVLRIVQSVPDDRILLESISKFGTITLPEGTSLLHAAAQGKNPNLAKELLARGMKPDHRNADGNTAMHLAASNMASNAHRLYEEVFTELMDAGATINLENQRGDTPVHLLRNLQYTTSKSNENSGPLKSMETLLTKLSQDPTFAAAKACRPGNLEQLITACYHGETAEVNQLALDDPMLNQKLRGSAAIHAAAEGGHLGTLQALVSKGADLTIKGPQDRNVLHIQCSAGIDDGPLAAYIIQTMGASSSERDRDGRTPLMLAAENGLSGPAKEMLASPHKVFFNSADNTGMTPFMYSVLKSDIGEGKCEQEFYSAFPELDSDGPGKPVSVVEMLKWMTNVDDPEAIPEELLEQIYQELYDDPVLRPVLEVAARSGSGPRTTDPNRFGESALRINASNGSGPAGGGGQGNYMPYGNRLNFGAKQNHGQPQGKGFWLDSVKGTLIHELTHHAAAITYDNDAIPVPKGQGNGQTDPQKSQAYVTAFEEDVRNASHLAMTEEEQRVVLLVSARLTTYQKELQLPGRLLSGGENMQVELIVGISQAIAELGLPLVQKMYPKLSKHYMDVFAKDVEDRCTDNDLLSPDLDDNLGVKNRQVVNSPDKLFASPTVYNAEKIWEFIAKEFTFAKGVLSPSFQTSSQDGVPVWNVSCLQLDTADKNLLERLKPLVTKMLEKELSNSDLPPQFATDRIRELVRTVSAECQKFDTNADPKTEGKKLLTSLKNATDTFTTNASQDFEQDYLASTRQRLERMTTKDYTLSARDIAELTVVRASDTASQLASSNDAVSVNPKKLSKIIDFLESKLEELMKTDENLKKSPEKYIDKYVQALVNDKDFFVKKKGKASGHVSAKVSGVKSLWKSKLRKIKV